MLSVQEIQRRRLKNRAPPPGFKISDLENINNSAKEQKRVETLSFSSTANFVKKLVNIKHVLKIIPRKEKPSKVTVIVKNEPYEDIVGGEKVMINKFDITDEEEKDMEMDTTLTPEGYDESYDFYFHINQNRKDVLRLINKLGEMLVFYELEGDVDDWARHVEKTEREIKEWKKRCRRSDAYFEKTGRVLGVDEKTVKYKFHSYVSEKADDLGRCMRNTFSKAKEACPLLGVVCPCVESSVERVRSIYSESWHLDEPVPDLN